MKIFTNKSIWKKIVIAFLIVLLFQFAMIKPVHADVVEFGGKLMSPILSLVVGICDGINDIIGRTIMGAASTLYEVEMGNTFWETLGTVLIAIAVAAITIALVVVTAGAAAALLAAIGITATVTVGIGTVVAGVTAGLVAAVWFNDQVLPDNLYLPMYTYSVEEIFKGNILLFDVDFFNNEKEMYVALQNGTHYKLNDYNDTEEHKDYLEQVCNIYGISYYFYYDYNNLDENGNPTEIKTSNQDSAVILKKTISSWYNALRNICLVLMLSVLVYIGIRMLLSSVASDKAKYLTMLKDWFIGLCILFLMHYIMAFSVRLVENLTEVVKTTVDENAYMVILPATDKVKEAVEDLGLEEGIIQKEGDSEYLYWPTNLMGSLRIQLQMEQYGAQYIGLCICFVMLCLFTLYFTVVYLKRVLHMAFLTLIAPLVALTYCIDKLNDGQAQGFNKWFKEYIFNLLIQPMHLLLYYILVTSAFELAANNIVYSIVALAFMIPAEKLLRSLFGFEKAQTAPVLGPAGAMMASSALTHLLHKGPKGKGDAGEGKLDSDESQFGKVPMSLNNNPVQSFLNEANEDSDNKDDSSNSYDEANAETQQYTGMRLRTSQDAEDNRETLPQDAKDNIDRQLEEARQRKLEREKSQQVEEQQQEKRNEQEVAVQPPNMRKNAKSRKKNKENG